VRAVPGLAGRWWPEPVDEELLRVAVGPAPGVTDAWKRARRSFVLDHATGPQLELAPLVWRRLTDAGVEDPDLPRLKGIHRRTWYLNQQRRDELARLVAAFAAERIPMLVLKGAALAPLYYRDVGLRPMGDIDLLVPRSQWDRTLGFLARHGWHRRLHPSADVFGLGQAEPLDHPTGSVLDLHWLVGWEFRLRDDPDRSTEPFWAAAIAFDPVAGAPAPAWTLCAADHLLHLCAHATRASGVAMLRGLADAATLISTTTPTGALDWDRLAAQARRYHLTRTVYEVLTYLDRALQAGVPQSTRQALAACPVGFRDRLVFRARANPEGWEPLVGGASRTLTAYLVMTAGLPASKALRMLPEWLRVMAGLDHTWQVPVQAARFARRRLARRAGARATT